MSSHDPNSYAEPDKVVITDLALDLGVDFAKKELAGSRPRPGLEGPGRHQLVLDTRDLDIAKVEGRRQRLDAGEVRAGAGKDKILGSKLTHRHAARNPSRCASPTAPSPNASGLQWLTPAMTEGKKTPFMFSQSQRSTRARWVPLQDTPQRALHLHRARDRAEGRDGADERRQRSEGRARRRLHASRCRSRSRRTCWRSPPATWCSSRSATAPACGPNRRWSTKAATEFADTEKMIADHRAPVRPVPLGPLRHPGAAAVVPVRRHGKPAPDLRHADRDRRRQVAGLADRARAGAQLVGQPGDVLQLRRTCWLNEGFTSYVENRIVEALYGKERADMEKRDRAQRAAPPSSRTSIRSCQVLALQPRRASDPDEHLQLDASTPRARGSCSSSSSASAARRSMPFLRGYFDHFAFQSIPTATSSSSTRKANLLDKYPGKVSAGRARRVAVRAGHSGRRAEDARRARFDAVDAARKAWLEPARCRRDDATGEVDARRSGCTSSKACRRRSSPSSWPHSTPPTTSPARRTARSRSAGIRWPCAAATRRRNAAIADVPAAHRPPQADHADLQRAGEDAGRPEASPQDVFAKARPGYHPITTGSVEAGAGIEGAKPLDRRRFVKHGKRRLRIASAALSVRASPTVGVGAAAPERVLRGRVRAPALAGRRVRAQRARRRPSLVVPARPGARPPIVLLHGFTGARRTGCR